MQKTTPAVFLASLILLAGCAPSPGAVWGREVPASRAISLSELLEGEEEPPGGQVVVRGRVGEVCRASGCWFVLQDSSAGKIHEILVDLLPEAGFTVPRSIQGRTARVAGRLSGEAPDRRLIATGLVLES